MLKISENIMIESRKRKFQPEAENSSALMRRKMEGHICSLTTSEDFIVVALIHSHTKLSAALEL